jgi:hypothetical protein
MSNQTFTLGNSRFPADFDADGLAAVRWIAAREHQIRCRGRGGLACALLPGGLTRKPVRNFGDKGQSV